MPRFLPLRLFPLLLTILLLAGLGQSPLEAQEAEPGEEHLTLNMARLLADQQPTWELAPLGAAPCAGGFAGIYPCSNIDLLAFMPLGDIGGGSGNDIWGWTDPVTGHEYALMGRTSGTAFVDITDPENPLYVGNLPPHGANSVWRDIKVYNDYAFIVSEASGHGMQVFDLSQLRDVVSPPVTFAESAHYDGISGAHNIAINPDSPFAYIVGSNDCLGGLHMVKISNPLNPGTGTCFSQDGYTHDTQCVNYAGPDPDYQGKEICFNANEDTITIVNVSNKSAPVQISRTGYAGSGYTHQGWLTPDQGYFLLDDELDELSSGDNTRTYIWDMADLDQPLLINSYLASTPAIDHNQYIRGNYAFQSNYRAGLRILDAGDVANGNLSEVGYFDIYPADDNASFNGAWSVYPYFDSGVVVVSGIEQGLFVLQPHLAPVARFATTSSAEAALPGQTVVHAFTLENLGPNDSYELAVAGNNWPATLLSSNPLPLSFGQSATVEVAVEVPEASGSIIVGSDSFTLTATSLAEPSLVLTATATTEAVVEPGLSLLGAPDQVGWAGQTLSYTVVLTNAGNYTDTFALSLGPSDWSSSLTAGELALGPGDAGSLTVAVIVGHGPEASVALTATSAWDPAVQQTVLLHSSTYLQHLPLLAGD